MSLLAPLFLLGLGMIALPLWLHRLQTMSPEREPFSSAMLLSASEQRILLRRKLRYLLLLALRIALLALLALAFAQPLLQRTGQAAPDRDSVRHLLIIDNSFSMGQGDHLAHAVDAARGQVQELAAGDSMQIVTAADGMELIAGPSSNIDDLRRALALVRPAPGRLDYGVMMAAAGNLIRDAAMNVTIHIFSDFQQTGLPARFSDLLPKPIQGGTLRLQLHPVAEQDIANRAVTHVVRTETGLEAGLRAWHNDPGELLMTLAVNGQEQGRQALPVPASGQVLFRFPDIALARGDNRIEAAISPPDGLQADDRYHAVIDNAPRAPVLLITSDPGSRSVTYLSTALQLAGGGYAIEPVTVAELDPRILQRYLWVVVDDLGIIPAGLSRALQDYLENGGAVFAAAGEHAAALATLPVSGHRIASAPLRNLDQYFSVARIDNSHPVLAATAGWRSISVSRSLPLQPEPADQVLITLDNGAPLLVSRNTGRGRLLLLTTSLDNTWNDLPVHPVFVSFMAEAARYLADEQLTERQQIAGTAMLLQQSGYAAGQVIDPRGRQVLALADTQRAPSINLNLTGFYEVYTPIKDYLVAVNPDLRESDTTRMPAETMQRWQATQIMPPANTAAAPGARPELPPLELWHTILILLVLMALAESMLGNRYLRMHTGPDE